MAKLKGKRVRGRVEVLKAMKYRGCMVYVRRYDKEIFTYDAVIDGEIYFGYLVMKPKKGTTKLTDEEVQSTRNLIWAGAETTIDTKLGIKLDKATKKKAQAVIELAEETNLN